MKNIFNIKKNYFNYFLFFFTIVGVYLSLNIGITHDEAHSTWIWELNKKKILKILFDINYEVISLNESLGYNQDFNLIALDSFHGFYGIGFYLASFPFEKLITFFYNLDFINEEGKQLLTKHPFVLIYFVIGGLYLKKILFLITNNELTSNLSSIFFLTYPYLFGHSLFNVKDIPLMSVWIVCTYFFAKIMLEFFDHKKVRFKKIFIISMLTAHLLSLRISGILIFIEYLFFIFFFIHFYKMNFIYFLKSTYKFVLIFLFSFLFFLYSFYPSLWADPLRFFDSISFMSQHFQSVCTVTLGECMKAQNLPSSYVFIWLFYKLPIFILFGILVFIFTEKKIFSNKQNVLILGPLISSVVTIIFLLIFFDVNLYDELRQILFIFPLIFIISIVAINQFLKKFFSIFISLFIIFFLYQNLKLYPYNYLWINNFNLFTEVNKNFEKDYWGVSTKKIAQYFNKNELNKNECLISNRNNGIKYFLNRQNTCLKTFNNLHKKNNRPFYIALTERSLNKGTPNQCDLISGQSIYINFSNEKIDLAKIYKCD